MNALGTPHSPPVASAAHATTRALGELVLRYPDHVVVRDRNDLARVQAQQSDYEPVATAAPISVLVYSPPAFTYVLRDEHNGVGELTLLPNRIICRESDLPTIHPKAQATYRPLATVGEWSAYELVGTRPLEAFTQRVGQQRGTADERARRVRDELIRQQAFLPAGWDAAAIFAATDYLREHPGVGLACAMREGAKVAITP